MLWAEYSLPKSACPLPTPRVYEVLAEKDCPPISGLNPAAFPAEMPWLLRAVARETRINSTARSLGRGLARKLLDRSQNKEPKPLTTIKRGGAPRMKRSFRQCRDFSLSQRWQDVLPTQ
jgi:hypothetical protein